MNTDAPQFILIDKPAGWTSFDVVNFIRKSVRGGKSTRPPLLTKSLSRTRCGKRVGVRLPERGEAVGPPLLTKERVGVRLPERNDNKPTKLRVGHAGTLDPFATGLLIVGIGREATKRLDEFKQLPKTYLATIRLGAVSDTDDPTGEISNFQFPISPPASQARALRAGNQFSIPNESMIKTALKKFTGEQKQTPPMYSAKKINGQRLYKLARAGKTVDRRAEDITIHEIKFLDYSWPDLKIEVQCSAGTYIRTLARDIGDALGTGAYCTDLRRTKIGEYDVKNAEKISNFQYPMPNQAQKTNAKKQSLDK